MKRKIYKINLLLTIVALLFASCADDVLLKSDYDYKQDASVGLATIELNQVEKATDESISLSATVSSWGNSEVLDQGFLISEKEDFSVISSTLSIEVDEYGSGAELVDENVGIAQGKTFFVKAFVLSKDGLALSSTVKSINLPVTWVSVGSVKFTDNTFTGDTYDVEIQKFEGRDEYRLVNPFDTEEEGAVIRFFLDEEWNADNISNGLQAGSGKYSFYWHANYVGQYCNFTNNANKYVIEFLLYNNEDDKLYLGGEVLFEWNEGYPGEIPEPVRVTYQTNFSNENAQAGWVLDKFSGFGKEDNVWFFNMAEVGAASAGNAVAAYIEDEPYRIISPSITVDEDDILSFNYYPGLFGSENAKVKVYIREEGAPLGEPIKDWDLETGDGGSASIPLDEYVGKSIKVIFVVEEGDFLFYQFAVAETDNTALIF